MIPNDTEAPAAQPSARPSVTKEQIAEVYRVSLALGEQAAAARPEMEALPADSPLRALLVSLFFLLDALNGTLLEEVTVLKAKLSEAASKQITHEMQIAQLLQERAPKTEVLQ